MSATSSERNEQRRKLLKKAALAPAIFVVPVGRVLAASSLTCIDKGLEGVNVNAIPKRLPKDQTDQWVRQFKQGSSGIGGQAAGNYLQYDPQTGQPVAYASCWNSVNPSPPHAEQGTNLIP